MEQLLLFNRLLVFWVLCFITWSIGAYSTAYAQATCSATNDNTCTLYDCVENACRCDTTSHNYPKTFGLKYCQRFASNTRFSAQGVAWRNKTLRCLKREMAAAYAAHGPEPRRACDCEAIEKAAIDSHKTCYLAPPSVCSLKRADWAVIYDIVDGADIVRLGLNGFLTTVGTGWACIAN